MSRNIDELIRSCYKKILNRHIHTEELNQIKKDHFKKLKSTDGMQFLESVLLDSNEYKTQLKGKVMWNSFRERTESHVYSLPIKPIPKNAQNTVVIVEPREHVDFKYVIYNIMHMCNGEWSLHIFHGLKNETYVKNITKHMGDVHYHNLNVDNLLPLPMGTSLDDLYKSKDFWNKLKSHKYALCIQTDTLMIDKNIKPFLEFDYDYIGAPWKDKVIGCNDNIKVGCGGYSLRKIQSMLNVIKANKYEKYTPEDVYFSKYCKNVAPLEIAQYFCTEHIFNEFSLGIHRPWMYAHNEKLLKKLEYYIYNIE